MSNKLDELINAKGWRKGQVVKLGYQDIEKYAQERAERYAAKLLIEMSVGNIKMIKSPTVAHEVSFDIPEHLTYEALNLKTKI